MRIAVFGALVLAAAASLWAAENYRVVNGPKDFYFGHISYIEPAPEGTDPLVFRIGNPEPEQGVLNLPVGPGDTVRTSPDRRCEIQFDTGTIVRLDFATEVRIETILARSLSSIEALSVLSLDRGRVYVMYKEYSRREMFQVLAPNAAVKMKHNSVALVSAASDGTTEAQVIYGRAQALFGPSEERLEDRMIKKGERLIVLGDHQFELAGAIQGTAFELWNKDINAQFDALHEGLTALPKPVQKLPPAVFYFAQTYGNRNGEWLWDELYGYVWRPFIDNGAYPWGWSPYYYGRWSYTGGQMFWVPQEPWGWVPYHLGIWQWDKKRGWFWLPGSMFAPAWVAWDFYFGYACWRPWSMFDWMAGSNPWMGGFAYDGSGWSYGWPRIAASAPGSGALNPAKTVVRRDSLKQPAASSLPVPSELKAALKRATVAFEKGDLRLRDAAADVSKHLVFVSREDLRSLTIGEKALTWDQVPKAGAPSAGTAPALRPADPRREVVRLIRGAESLESAPRQMAPAAGLGARPAARAAFTGEAPARGPSSAARFRDWNPDLRVARELGVRIEYSSVGNEIRCPELNLSSRDRERATPITPRLTSSGISYGPAASFGGGATGDQVSGNPSVTSSTASATGQRQPQRTSTSTGSKESAGGAKEGGAIKK